MVTSPFSAASRAPWLQGSIVFVGALFAVLLWAGIAHQIIGERDRALEHAQANAVNLARTFEEHVVRTLKGIDQSLLDLIAQFESDPTHFHMAAATDKNRFLEGLTPQIGIIDANGRLTHTTASSGLGIDLSDREHFRVHREGHVGLFISKPVLGRASGRWSIQFTRAIRHADGAFAGVFVVSIDPYYFSRFYESVDVGSAGVVVLVGLDGVVRARAALSDSTIGQSVVNGAAFKAAQKQPTGVIASTSPVDGMRRLYAYRVLPQLPLMVTVGLAKAEILADQQANIWRYIATGAIVTALILIACGLLTYQVRRQQQTEMELAAEREKLRQAHSDLRQESTAIIRSSPVGIHALDDSGCVTMWNLAMERLSGYAASEVLGSPPPLFAANDVAELYALGLRQTPGDPKVRLMHGTARGGRSIDVNVTTAPLAGPEGSTRGLIVVVEDVTVRRAIEAQLRESEERLRGIAANLPGVLYQRISRRDGSYAYTYVSDYCVELSGLTAEEWCANASLIRHGITAESLPAFDNAIRTAARTMKAASVEVQFVKKSGERRWWRSMFQPRLLPNGDLLWDGLVFDITDQQRTEEQRRELENQLRHAQKIEALGTLAGGIAHDINNTLVPIVGLTQVTLEALPDDDPLREAVKTVLDAAYRARDLVAQILAFSRKDTPKVERLRLQDVVAKTVRLLAATLPPNVDLVQRTSVEVGAINGDENQLVQVLMNLCTNAAHAISPKSGRIVIALDEISASAGADAQPSGLPAGQCARLTVLDDGCGMEARTLERVFEPFYTTKGVGEGTGLGLSIVHGIVTNHGGHISVESEPGRGTTFTILLPLVEEAGQDTFDGTTGQLVCA